MISYPISTPITRAISALADFLEVNADLPNMRKRFGNQRAFDIATSYAIVAGEKIEAAGLEGDALLTLMQAAKIEVAARKQRRVERMENARRLLEIQAESERVAEEMLKEYGFKIVVM